MGAISTQLDKDIIAAMKARQQDRLTTLRMVKSVLKSREIDKREALTDAEEQAALTTMLKQRRESMEQFTRGGRPELAEKEHAELALIEAYMPQAAGEEEVRAIVEGAVEHVAAGAAGQRPGVRDMGAVMKVAQQRALASGLRVDGKVLSEMVKAELARADAPL